MTKILLRKCWICKNNILSSEQIKYDLPCLDCQKNKQKKVRQKKNIHVTPYIPFAVLAERMAIK